MTRVSWWLAETASRLLEPDERDAVRGDLAESGETGRQALRAVLGLVIRRQAVLWKDWRPWLALLGLVPLGVQLSLFSRHVADTSAIFIWMYANNWTWTYVTNPSFRLDLAHYIGVFSLQYISLTCMSWMAAFMLGSLSRRAILVNGSLYCLVLLFAAILAAPPNRGPEHDAVFSLTFYDVIFPLIVQAMLVLLPSVWAMKISFKRA
jgi:hypothetical protein